MAQVLVQVLAQELAQEQVSRQAGSRGQNELQPHQKSYCVGVCFKTGETPVV